MAATGSSSRGCCGRGAGRCGLRYGRRFRPTSDAGINAERFRGEIENAVPSVLEGARLIVDALLGAGLDRDIEGRMATLIEAVNRSRRAGRQRRRAERGRRRERRGARRRGQGRPHRHVLPPEARPSAAAGPRSLRRLAVADIGIPDRALEAIDPKTHENGPDLWVLPKLEARGPQVRPRPLRRGLAAGRCRPAPRGSPRWRRCAPGQGS